MEHLSIDVRESTDSCVLELSGELDMASSPELTAKAEEVLTRAVPVVLDLRNLRFIDSTGLGSLAGVDRSARKAGTTLSLVPGPPSVQRVFEVSGTTDAFTWIEPAD